MNIIAKFDSENPFKRQVKVIFLRMATEYLILQPLTFVKRVILSISTMNYISLGKRIAEQTIHWTQIIHKWIYVQ